MRRWPWAWFAGVHSNVGGSYNPDGLANEALQAVASGAGKQTILVPANALEAFGDAFKMLKGRA